MLAIAFLELPLYHIEGDLLLSSLLTVSGMDSGSCQMFVCLYLDNHVIFKNLLIR